MDLGRTGKRALVAGSTAGIGIAIAKGLAMEGANVVLTGRAQATVDAALTRLKESLPEAKVTGLAADCATAACASPAIIRPAWRSAAGAGSSSCRASRRSISQQMIHSGTTKAAQLAISRGMAIELAGTGVTVNALLPGPTHTETTDKLRAERAKSQGITEAEIEPPSSATSARLR